jgi:hypothetical protein
MRLKDKCWLITTDTTEMVVKWFTMARSKASYSAVSYAPHFIPGICSIASKAANFTWYNVAHTDL